MRYIRLVTTFMTVMLGVHLISSCKSKSSSRSSGGGGPGGGASGNKSYSWTDVSLKSGSDITMRDNVTSLWWSNLRPERMNWEKAERECANLSYNGQSDWRLPSREELQAAYRTQISSHGREGWIDKSNFLGRIGFWSGSEHSASTSLAWAVSLADGESYYPYKVFANHVVCVR